MNLPIFYLLLVDSSYLYSSLVFVPLIETVLAIIIHHRIKHIPVSHIYLCKLVPCIYLCQHLNTLVHIKDILRVSAFQNVSIMTREINVRRSVTPQFATFDRTNSYILLIRAYILVYLYVFPSPV